MLVPPLADLMGGNSWLQIGMGDLLFAVILFIINIVVMTFVFYVAGVVVVGKRKALFSDAFVISLLGTVVGNICLLFFPVLIGLILSLIIWLLLIKHYYETGWLGALAVAVLAVIIYVVVFVILSLLFAIPLLLLAG